MLRHNYYQLTAGDVVEYMTHNNNTPPVLVRRLEPGARGAVMHVHWDSFDPADTDADADADGGGGGATGGGQGGDGDPEAVTAQQARLWSLAPRTSALAVGRGAFTLGTSRARPTESLRVPTLTLAGCLPAQRGATVKLDLAAASPSTDFTAWPEFHNGTAAALCSAACNRFELSALSSVLSSATPPDTPTYSADCGALGLAERCEAHGLEDEGAGGRHLLCSGGACLNVSFTQAPRRIDGVLFLWVGSVLLPHRSALLGIDARAALAPHNRERAIVRGLLDAVAPMIEGKNRTGP